MTGGAAIATAEVACVLVSLAAMSRGYLLVRRGDVAAHRRWMLAAFAASAAFLVLFVGRVATWGVQSWQVAGPRRVPAFGAMVLHDGAAVASIPLVLVALALGLSGRVAAHREVAPWALGLWLYAAITGVASYVVLYGSRG